MQVLAIGSIEYIAELEVKAIAIYRTQDRQFGYNISDGGDGSRGFKHTPDQLAKMAKGRIGRRLTEEHKANISKGLKGHKGCVHTEENKRLNGLRKKGQPNSMKGKTYSDEVRAKMSAAHAGVPLSPKRCAAISERLKGNKFTLGYKHTEETRAMMSAMLMGNKRSLGVTPSEETRAKLSDAQKARRLKEKLNLGGIS